MKWFKHHSDLSRGESVARFIELHGLAGYGRLNLVLEIVAERMDYSGRRCSVMYSRGEWARILRCSRKNAAKSLAAMSLISWFNLSEDDDFIEISVEKMVDWRDEYSRKKSGQYQDKSRSESHKKEQKKLDQEKTRKIPRRSSTTPSSGLRHVRDAIPNVNSENVLANSRREQSGKSKDPRREARKAVGLDP